MTRSANPYQVAQKTFLSIRKALQLPDAAKWREAIDIEYNKLVDASTWREPTPEELKSLQSLPIGILLNKKRDGTYKCRAVALGNFLDKTGLDLFAPTLSMVSHRLMLVAAARAGDYMICFDIDAAFLNAYVDIDILISLPAEFAKPGETRVKKLVKALYGLPQSPKAWFQHYASGLKTLGWEQCINEAAM